jgi:hypothetical protein
LTSTPATDGAINGELPSIVVSGSGEPGDPFDITLNDAWTDEVAGSPRGVMAYAEETGDQSGVTTVVDLTGLSATWTADPTRVYLTVLHIPRLLKNTAAGTVTGSITDPSNSPLTSSLLTLGAAEYGFMVVQVREAGLSGVTTRKGRIVTSGGGDLDIESAVGRPSFIMVSDVGAA